MIKTKVRVRSGDRQQGFKDCQGVFGLTFVTGFRPCDMTLIIVLQIAHLQL